MSAVASSPQDGCAHDAGPYAADPPTKHHPQATVTETVSTTETTAWSATCPRCARTHPGDDRTAALTAALDCCKDTP